MRGDVGVGELGPTPNTCLDDTARCHWVEVPDLKDTFHERGVGLLEDAPPNPLPQRAFALPTPGEFRIPCLLHTQASVERQLEILPHNFLVATAPRPHHLVPPHLAILCFHNPLKHNVAVPINKVQGGCEAATLLGSAGRSPVTPWGEIGKGFGGEGAFT